MKKKYEYKQYYVGLRPEEGKDFDELLQQKGIGFTEFVRISIDNMKKQLLESRKEELLLEKQEMKEYLDNFSAIEKSLKVSGDEKIISNLIRIKKRYIDKLKNIE